MSCKKSGQIGISKSSERPGSKLLRSLLIVAIAVLASSAAAVLPQERASGDSSTDSGPRLTQDQVTERLAPAKAKLESLPTGAIETSFEARLREAWQRRVQLLQEILPLFEKTATQKKTAEGLENRLQEVKTRLLELAQQALPETPESPTKEGFDALEMNVGEFRDRVSSLRAAQAEKKQYVEQIPQLLVQTRERTDAAQERVSRLTNELSLATEPVEQEILQTRIENAVLDAQVARLAASLLEQDRSLQKDLEPVRADELELAEQTLERLQQEYALYSESFQAQVARDQARLQEEEWS